MHGTQVSQNLIFWHVPEAIEVGRHLFGVRWNPDNATVVEVEEILFNLGMDARGEVA